MRRMRLQSYRMDNEALKLLWIGTALAAGVAIVITLIAAAGAIPKYSIPVLCVLGAACFSFSVIWLGWTTHLSFRSAIFHAVIWVAMAALGWWIWPVDNPAEKMEGELVAVESLPDVKANTYVIQLGTVGARFMPDLTNHEPWIINGRDKLRFDTDDKGQLLFSTIIRDRNGNRIVEVDKNIWRISKQDSQSWDKNYSRNELEVLDGRGIVVLHVKLFKNGIQLQGLWHDDKGNGLALIQIGPKGPASLAQWFSPDRENEIPEITKTFKYPSKEHWSEQDDY
jgi:hypothetical protein